MTWALGTPADDAQRDALAPLVAAAGRLGLSVIGWVAATADLERAATAARAAGLAALATDSPRSVAGVELLRFGDGGLADRARGGFLGVLDRPWPGLRESRADGADAESGPTGPPWLDSNAWYVRLARALLEPERVWLAFHPPDLGQPLAPAAYVQAIADSAVYGARWMLSLDPHLRAGLGEKRAAALESFAAIGRALACFERQRAWASYQPEAQLGVVSDYAGAHEFLAFEALNLLARQGSLYRVLEKARALEAPLEGLDAVLYLDEAPAPVGLARKLDAFVEQGGTLITPPGWPLRGREELAAWIPRFRVLRLGRGRLAVARDELADPFRLAEDAQLLMSHRHDRLRVFNPGLSQLHYAVREDGAAGVLHALLFQPPDPRMPTTVWFRRPWARARAFSADDGEPVPVERRVVEDGVELPLPPLPVYCALEVSA